MATRGFDKKKKGQYLGKMRDIDMFGEKFQLKLDGSVMAKTSYMGACLTLLTAIVTLGFLYTKIQTLNKKHDVDIMSATFDRAIPFT